MGDPSLPTHPLSHRSSLHPAAPEAPLPHRFWPKLQKELLQSPSPAPLQPLTPVYSVATTSQNSKGGSGALGVLSAAPPAGVKRNGPVGALSPGGPGMQAHQVKSPPWEGQGCRIHGTRTPTHVRARGTHIGSDMVWRNMKLKGPEEGRGQGGQLPHGAPAPGVPPEHLLRPCTVLTQTFTPTHTHDHAQQRQPRPASPRALRCGCLARLPLPMLECP